MNFFLPLQRTGPFASNNKARIDFVGFTVTIRFLPVVLRFYDSYRQNYNINEVVVIWGCPIYIHIVFACCPILLARRGPARSRGGAVARRGFGGGAAGSGALARLHRGSRWR